MRWGRLWGIAVAWVCLSGLAVAQSALEQRLNALPVSVGENTIITRQAGESWVNIGIREHVGYEQLHRANPVNIATAPTLFIPGRHQVQPLTTDGLVINLPELTDFHWQNGRVVAWYPVSIGRITSRWHTPVGTLQVVSLQKNPEWHRPAWAGGGTMPAGPDNPLGDRWIGLSRSGYGLHGTNDPTSVGRMVSHGCIRHFPPHIEELFDQATIGMPVIITYETITVGQDGGVVYLSVFPDIYARGTNAPDRVRQRLAEFGLDNILSGSELKRRLQQDDGVARALLGSNAVVTVNQIQLDTPVGPTFKGDASYLPLRSVAKALNAQLDWDAKAKTATLLHQDKRLVFPQDADGFLAFDTQFVPVRSTVEALGGSVAFSEGKIDISIP